MYYYKIFSILEEDGNRRHTFGGEVKNFVSEEDPMTRMSLDAGKRARRRRRNRSPIFQKSLSDLPEAAVVEVDIENGRLMPKLEEVVSEAEQNEKLASERSNVVLAGRTIEDCKTDLPQEEINSKSAGYLEEKCQKATVNDEAKFNDFSSANSSQASSTNDSVTNTNRRRRRREKALSQSFLQNNKATISEVARKADSSKAELKTTELHVNKDTLHTGSTAKKNSNLDDFKNKNIVTENSSAANISEDKTSMGVDKTESIKDAKEHTEENNRSEEDLAKSDEVLIIETERKDKRSNSIMSIANKTMSNKAVKSVRSVVKKVASVASGSSKISSTHKKYKVQYKTGIPKSTQLSPRSQSFNHKSVKQPTANRNETLKSKIPMSSNSKNNENNSRLNSPVSKPKVLVNSKKLNNSKVVSPRLNKANTNSSSNERIKTPTYTSRNRSAINSKSNPKNTSLNNPNKNIRNTNGSKKSLTTLNKTKNEQLSNGVSTSNKSPLKDNLTIPLKESMKETDLSVPEKSTSKIRTPTKSFALRKTTSSVTLCSQSSASSSVMMSPTPKKRPTQRMNRAAKLRMEQKAKKS